MMEEAAKFNSSEHSTVSPFFHMQVLWYTTKQKKYKSIYNTYIDLDTVHSYL